MNLKIPKTNSEILHNKKLLSKKIKNPYLITNNKICNTIINFNMIDT